MIAFEIPQFEGGLRTSNTISWKIQIDDMKFIYSFETLAKGGLVLFFQLISFIHLHSALSKFKILKNAKRNYAD